MTLRQSDIKSIETLADKLNQIVESGFDGTTKIYDDYATKKMIETSKVADELESLWNYHRDRIFEDIIDGQPDSVIMKRVLQFGVSIGRLQQTLRQSSESK